MELFRDKIYRSPRTRSNLIYQHFVDVFGTEIRRVINVSGWNDQDKNGRTYQSYFKSVQLTSYDVSNKGGYRGNIADNQLLINLEDRKFSPTKTYDLVFCHTVLEHVFDVFNAARILCELTDRFVFCVVPHVQEIHGTKDFGDYWRFNPDGIQTLFLNNEIKASTTLFAHARGSSSYLCLIGSKDPDDQDRLDQVFFKNREPKFVSNNFLYVLNSVCKKLKG